MRSYGLCPFFFIDSFYNDFVADNQLAKNLPNDLVVMFHEIEMNILSAAEGTSLYSRQALAVVRQSLQHSSTFSHFKCQRAVASTEKNLNTLKLRLIRRGNLSPR